jgi:SLT domain-containing protein
VPDETSEFLISIIIEAIDRATPTLTKLAGEIEALKRASGSTGLEPHPTAAMQKGLEDTAASAEKLDTTIKRTTQDEKTFAAETDKVTESLRRRSALAREATASAKEEATAESDLEKQITKLVATAEKYNSMIEKGILLSDSQKQRYIEVLAQLRALEDEEGSLIDVINMGTDSIVRSTIELNRHKEILRQVVAAQLEENQAKKEEISLYDQLRPKIEDATNRYNNLTAAMAAGRVETEKARIGLGALANEYAGFGRRFPAGTMEQIAFGSIAAGIRGLPEMTGGMGGGGGRPPFMPVPFWGSSGLPGWARFGLPLAGMGSLAAFGGLGADRALFTMLGLGGSAVGGMLGGGLLGGAALATTAVGQGADIAVMRSTIADTRTLYQQYQQLQQAVAVYGAHSQQAAQQQALLNFQMRQLGPAAGVELALAKQVASLNQLWDRMTARARETAVGILSQFVGLARDYVPLVAQAAERNLGIINRAINTAPPGQVSLMDFLRGPMRGIFRDLEDIFARRLPTSVHAFTQALELTAKVIDYVATHFLRGRFIEAVDDFFTKWNDPRNWDRVTDLVDKLIHDFEVWKNFLVILAKDVADIFKGAAGQGTTIIETLTKMLDKLHAWLITTSGQQQLHTIFELHLKEVLALLSAITPLVEVFGRLYLTISPPLIMAFTGIITALSTLLNTFVNLGNYVGGPFKMLWNNGVLIPFGLFLIAWKTWDFTTAVSRFKALGSVMLDLGSAMMHPIQSLTKLRDMAVAAWAAFRGGEGIAGRFRAAWGSITGGGTAAAADPATAMREGIVSGSTAGADIMRTAIIEAGTTVAETVSGGMVAAGTEAGGQLALFEMAGAGVPGAAGAVGGAGAGAGEGVLAGAGVAAGASSRAVGLLSTAGRFLRLGGIAAAAYAGYQAIGGASTTRGTGLGSMLTGIPTSQYLRPTDVGTIPGSIENALSSIPLIGPSIFGAFGNVDQTTVALQNLQKQLGGISDPAQLSAQQIASLRGEMNRILAMPDITAKQRNELRQLVVAFNPVHVATDRYMQDFQAISVTTGSIMQQVQQIIATHNAAITADMTRGTTDWYNAIKGNYGAAIATLEQLNAQGVLSTDKMKNDINRILRDELLALGIPGSTVSRLSSTQVTQATNVIGAGVAPGAAIQGLTGGGGSRRTMAIGGYEPATAGGRMIQVAEAGYPEVVLTTDPRYAPRQRDLLGQYLRAAPSVMGFQAGGIVEPAWTGPGGALGAIGMDAGAIMTRAANALLGNYVGMGGSLTGVGGGATSGFPVNVPGSLTNWLMRGMQVAGVSGPLWLPMLQRQAMRESGGNPSSINRWDVNAQRGDPSEGLLQTTLTTFATYHVPGYGNILNPVDNTAAAIRYMIAAYGHGSSAAAAQVMWGRGGGAYQTGGWAFHHYNSAQAFFNSFPPNQNYTAVNPLTGRRQTMTNAQWKQVWAQWYHNISQHTAAAQHAAGSSGATPTGFAPTSAGYPAGFTPMRGNLMYSPAGAIVATHQFQQHSAAAYQAQQQAELNALQNMMTGIQDTLGTSATGLQSQMAGMQTLGTYGILPGQAGYTGGDVVTRSLVSNAQAQIARYTQVLRRAQAEGQRDVAAQAQQQIDQLRQSITSYTAGLLQAQIQYFNQQAQYETSQLQRESRLAQVLARGPQFVGGILGTTLAAQAQMNVLTGTRQNILGQLGTLGGFLGQAEQQGNVGLAQQIRDQMDELNTQLKENTQAISDQTVAINQTTIDFINARTQFQTGVFGGLFSAVQTAGQLTGSLNVPLASSILTANQGVLQGGLGGLLGSLSSVYGINLTGLANNPTGLISALAGLNYGQIEQGMTSAQIGQFEGLINSITQNIGALEQNTVQLQQLNGQLNQPQQFSSSAWQMFRTAIFTGMGGLLPTYAGIPGLSPGTATGLPMPGINTTLNAGTAPVVGGDFNLNVVNPSTVLDPAHVMSTAAFALKTQT